MGRFTFDEDDDQEPTFSLADFKKWLSKQGKADPNLKNEGAEVKEEKPSDEVEDKKAFKEKLKNRRKKKTD